MTWAIAAKTDGFPLLRHNVFFSSDYRAEFDALFGQARLPREPTVYVCAQDRADGKDLAAENGPERLLCLVNAPAGGDLGQIDPQELQSCEEAMFRLLSNCGLTVRRRPEAIVRTTPADFEQLFPATGGALYGRATHGWAASFARPGSRTRVPGLYLAGGSVASGPWPADGGAIGPASGGERDGGPGFDRPIGPGGYAWWYVDALSDDGRNGLTIIAFIGSVFSPYYAWSGRGDPLNHCAVNVAIYRQNNQRWAMTERGRDAVAVDRDVLTIGPSTLSWEGSVLKISVDEVAVPSLARIRGAIRIEPTAVNKQSFLLDAAGRHLWRPIAPAARVSVALSAPDLDWSGDGYFDMNAGQEPLELGFAHWTWSRATLRRGSAIQYDVGRRLGEPLSLSLRFDQSGALRANGAAADRQAPRHAMARDAADARRRWPSQHCAHAGGYPFLRPFVGVFAIVRPAHNAVHESLSLDRFANPLVRLMLPFRMPRRR